MTLLLSIFGEGEVAFGRAKFVLGFFIIVLFVSVFCMIVYKLHIFDGIFNTNRMSWSDYYKNVVERDENSYLGKMTKKTAKKIDEDFEYGSTTKFGSEGKKLLRERRNRNKRTRG